MSSNDVLYGNYRKMSTLTAAVLNISTGIEIGQYKSGILSADSNEMVQEWGV